MLSSLSFGRRLAAVSLLSALAAGCSASGTTPSSTAPDTRALSQGRIAHATMVRTASHSKGWLSPDAKGKNLIYWGNFYNNTITIYSSKGVNGKQKGQITTGLSEPERLFVDKQLNVYSSNLGNSTITMYKPGQTSPSLTISDGVSNPTGLTVDAAGTVYCANVGNNTITEYPRGQTTPSVTIPLSNSAEYLATDAQDNLYDSDGSEVIEFAKGSSSGKNLNLNIGSPEAIEVDHSGNLIVLDWSNSMIDIFPAGQTQPSKQISASSAFAFSLSKNEKQLYVSASITGGFIVQTLAYPNGTTLSNKLTTNAGNWPIAVSPDNALGS